MIVVVRENAGAIAEVEADWQKPANERRPHVVGECYPWKQQESVEQTAVVGGITRAQQCNFPRPDPFLWAISVVDYPRPCIQQKYPGPEFAGVRTAFASFTRQQHPNVPR